MSDTDDCLLYVALALHVKKKRKKRRYWMRGCLKKRREVTHERLLKQLQETPAISDVLGISVEIFERLLQLVSPYITKMDTLMREAIPPNQRLFTALWYLATGTYFHKLERTLEMSTATISKIVMETCNAIISVLANYMRIPATPAAWETSAQAYNDRWHFPNCLAALAAKHVPIKNPRKSQACYYNTEKFFSVILIVAVDAHCEFQHVEVDMQSRQTDNVVFERSGLNTAYLAGELNLPGAQLLPGSTQKLPYVFIGDEGFPLKKQLMTPFELTKDMPAAQKIYNYRLQRAQRCAQNAIGLLTSRFGIFRKLLQVSPERADKVVRASCYLHNYLMRNARQNYMPAGITDEENLQLGTVSTGAWRKVGTELTSLQPKERYHIDDAAAQVRKRYCEYFSEEGKVPWQQQFL